MLLSEHVQSDKLAETCKRVREGLHGKKCGYFSAMQ
jgi:hypothetical protein